MTQEELKELKIGDLVKLKSGSPRMIVDKIENNLISCVLWDEQKIQLKMIDNIDYAFLELIK